MSQSNSVSRHSSTNRSKTPPKHERETPNSYLSNVSFPKSTRSNSHSHTHSQPRSTISSSRTNEKFNKESNHHSKTFSKSSHFKKSHEHRDQKKEHSQTSTKIKDSKNAPETPISTSPPQIITMQVGGNEDNEPMSKVTTPLSLVTTSGPEITFNGPMTISYEDLDKLLDKYAKLIKPIPNETPSNMAENGDNMTFGSKESNNYNDKKTAIDYQSADTIRQTLIDIVYELLNLYVDWIRLRAQEIMKPLLQSELYLPLIPFFSKNPIIDHESINGTTQMEEKSIIWSDEKQHHPQRHDDDFKSVVYTLYDIQNKLVQLLDRTLKREDLWQWQEYQTQLKTLIPQKENIIKESKEQLQISWNNTQATVSVWLAKALDETLNRREFFLQSDVEIVAQVYTIQHRLLTYCIKTYITFYDMLLSHWQRSIEELSIKSQEVLNKISQSFKEQTSYNPIESLVHSYENFLNQKEKHIPAELRISAQPRQTWKLQLSKNQPHECIRIIQQELNMIYNHLIEHETENVELRSEIEQWRREFTQYDWQKVKNMTDKKGLLQKQMEDIVEIETRKLCLSKWQELVIQVDNLGSGVHSKVAQHLEQLNSKYMDKQNLLVWYNSLTRHEVYNYKSQLALKESVWASNLEQREFAIEDLYMFKYRLLAVNGIFEMINMLRNWEKQINSSNS